MKMRRFLFFLFLILSVSNLFGVTLSVTPEILYGTSIIPADYYFDPVNISICVDDSDLALFDSDYLWTGNNLHIINPNPGTEITIFGDMRVGADTLDPTPIDGTGILLVTDSDINNDLGDNQALVQGDSLTILPADTPCSAPALQTTTVTEINEDNFYETIYAGEKRVYSAIRGNNINIRNYGELHVGYILATGNGATVNIENCGGVVVIGGILSEININIENCEDGLSETYICHLAAGNDITLLQSEEAEAGSLIYVGDCCDAAGGVAQKYYLLSVTLEDENGVWGLYNSLGAWIVNTPEVTRLYYNWDEGKDDDVIFSPFVEDNPPHAVIIASQPECFEQDFYLNVRINEDIYEYVAGAYYGTLVITLSAMP